MKKYLIFLLLINFVKAESFDFTPLKDEQNEVATAFKVFDDFPEEEDETIADKKDTDTTKFFTDFLVEKVSLPENYDVFSNQKFSLKGTNTEVDANIYVDDVAPVKPAGIQADSALPFLTSEIAFQDMQNFINHQIPGLKYAQKDIQEDIVRGLFDTMVKNDLKIYERVEKIFKKTFGSYPHDIKSDKGNCMFKYYIYRYGATNIAKHPKINEILSKGPMADDPFLVECFAFMLSLKPLSTLVELLSMDFPISDKDLKQISDIVKQRYPKMGIYDYLFFEIGNPKPPKDEGKEIIGYKEKEISGYKTLKLNARRILESPTEEGKLWNLEGFLEALTKITYLNEIGNIRRLAAVPYKHPSFYANQSMEVKFFFGILAVLTNNFDLFQKILLDEPEIIWYVSKTILNTTFFASVATMSGSGSIKMKMFEYLIDIIPEMIHMKVGNTHMYVNVLIEHERIGTLELLYRHGMHPLTITIDSNGNKHHLIQYALLRGKRKVLNFYLDILSESESFIVLSRMYPNKKELISVFVKKNNYYGSSLYKSILNDEKKFKEFMDILNK